MSLRQTAVRLAAGATVTLASALAGAAFDDLIREGEGPRRQALTAMELKPFPAAAWSGLADWVGGTQVTSVAAGKVVLIVTWKDWYAPSKRGYILAQKLAERHGAEGLVVVAVHDNDGWADFKKPDAAKNAALLIANDPKGDFRKALQVDNDPDFYLIDRAGQLRYADLATESVEGGVKALLAESADTAGGVNTRRASEAKARDLAERRTAAISNSVDLTNIPEQPYTPPTEQEYADAKWPPFPQLKDAREDAKAPDPIPLPVIDQGFLPEKPQLDGRVRIFYIWRPEDRRTYAIQPRMDLTQRQLGRDVRIIGVISPVRDDKGQPYPDDAKPDVMRKKIDDFLASRHLGHTLLMDMAGTLMNLIVEEPEAFPIPYVGISSSDNVVRWRGWMGEPAFEASLDRIIAADPGVKVRRKAEEAYIRDHAGQ